MVRLNLGCGNFKIKNFINVDIRENVSPDIVSDVRKLTLPNDYADIIVAYDILEHIEFREALSVINEWLRVLKPEGVLLIRIPNFIKIANNYKKFTFERLSALICGGQTYKENYHKAIFTPNIFYIFSRKLNFNIISFYYFKNSFNFMVKITKI